MDVILCEMLWHSDIELAEENKGESIDGVEGLSPHSHEKTPLQQMV